MILSIAAVVVRDVGRRSWVYPMSSGSSASSSLGVSNFWMTGISILAHVPASLDDLLAEIEIGESSDHEQSSKRLRTDPTVALSGEGNPD